MKNLSPRGRRKKKTTVHTDSAFASGVDDKDQEVCVCVCVDSLQKRYYAKVTLYWQGKCDDETAVKDMERGPGRLFERPLLPS